MTVKDPWPLDPPMATCPDCPVWQVPCEDEEKKAATEHRHDVHAHPMREPRPIPVVPTRPVSAVVATAGWWQQAIDAIADQPAGARFTIYEVCGHLGEPPNANGWQNLARDAEHIGLIRKIGGTESKRPGTKGSMTGLWQRTAHNPDRNRARRTA
jgi:hypothetical protein